MRDQQRRHRGAMRTRHVGVAAPESMYLAMEEYRMSGVDACVQEAHANVRQRGLRSGTGRLVARVIAWQSGALGIYVVKVVEARGIRFAQLAQRLLRGHVRRRLQDQQLNVR